MFVFMQPTLMRWCFAYFHIYKSYNKNNEDNYLKNLFVFYYLYFIITIMIVIILILLFNLPLQLIYIFFIYLLTQWTTPHDRRLGGIDRVVPIVCYTARSPNRRNWPSSSDCAFTSLACLLL